MDTNRNGSENNMPSNNFISGQIGARDRSGDSSTTKAVGSSSNTIASPILPSPLAHDDNDDLTQKQTSEDNIYGDGGAVVPVPDFKGLSTDFDDLPYLAAGPREQRTPLASVNESDITESNSNVNNHSFLPSQMSQGFTQMDENDKLILLEQMEGITEDNLRVAIEAILRSDPDAKDLSFHMTC